MPRVHGLDTTQRRRHGAQPPSSSGIFTPSFANIFAGRATAPTIHTTTANAAQNVHATPAVHLPSTAMTSLTRNLSLNMNVQQQQQEEEVPGTQNPNFPTNVLAPERMMAMPPPPPLVARNENAVLPSSNFSNDGGDDMTKNAPREKEGQFLDVGRALTSNLDDASKDDDGATSSSATIANNIANDEVTPSLGKNMTTQTGASSNDNVTTTASTSTSEVTSRPNSNHHDTMDQEQTNSAEGKLLLLTVPPGKQLGLSVKSDRILGGCTITKIDQACTFKDRVEVGDRIVVIDGKRVTQLGDLQSNHLKARLFGIVKKKKKDVECEQQHQQPTQEAASQVFNTDKDEIINYKDGMDDDDSVPNATQDDEDDEEQSVDLLTQSNNNNNNNDVNNTQPSPISPATQTLDRLSMIGSQDGGAELCVELSVNAVDTPLREGERRRLEKKDEAGVASKVANGAASKFDANAATATAVKEKSGSTHEDVSQLETGATAPRGSVQKSSSPSIVGTNGSQSLHNKPNDNGRRDKQPKDKSSTPLTKEQCIRNLKEYFMSTKNSSEYARNQAESNSGGMELPLVTFCHHCNNSNNNNLLSQVPHHSLCTRHEDFFVSGSYEILNLIVDGNLLGCNACISHFENGRPNKQLVHLETCKRYKAKGGRGGGGKRGQGGGGMGRLTQSSVSNNGAKQSDSSPSKKHDAATKVGTEKERSGSVNADSRGNNGRQDSPELSEYEKLRLRNIQRNEARLAALGLLGPSKNKKSSSAKSNKEGFLSRKESNNDGESKKARSKEKKKQQQLEVQKRTMPKRHKEKTGDEDKQQRRPMSSIKDNSSISNRVQQRASDVSVSKSKGKSTESISLMEAAKSGCRKCTSEWQTGSSDSSKSHDACCPRRDSSRLTNAEQQQKQRKPKSSKKSSVRTPLSQHSSQKKQTSSQVTPRQSSALHQVRHIGVATTAVHTSSIATQTDHAEKDSTLFQLALQKGFSSAFLRGKTEEELLALVSGNGRDDQQLQASLPPFIRDFITEADRNSEIPAPPGTKWLPCPNPWGKIGHEEGDFVVISPFQSASAADMISVFHQGPNGSIPKRFVANPLEEGSPYHETHRSPARKGYSVLRLTRDRMGLRPWGFTVRLHEFGGACLVDSIEPLSPAEAAEDISGWTDESTPSGLQLHDMIICVNGKSIGCMTEAELQIDLDLCGSDMMLVVARFDVEGDTNQEVTLEDLAMDWNDVGAGAPSRKKVVCFEEKEDSENRCELDTQPNFSTNVHNQDDRFESQDIENYPDDEESPSDEDVPDEVEALLPSTQKQHRKQQITLELESKSDEELMEKLYEIAESGKWKRGTDTHVARLLLKRGAVAAAKDEKFRRMSLASGGVTKEQLIEWMSKSETFQQYEQIMRSNWSERSIEARTCEALNDVGYTKASSGTLTKWVPPEDIAPRRLQGKNVFPSDEEADASNFGTNHVSSQNKRHKIHGVENESDEEESVADEDLPDEVDDSIPLSREQQRMQKLTLELESKSDEELMEKLHEIAESGNWNLKTDPRLAILLAKRGAVAAAKDKVFQRVSLASGGVTKEQVIEWMNRSETFQRYEQIMLSKWTERTFWDRTCEAMKDAGYTKASFGKWALPEDTVPQRLGNESDDELDDKEGASDEDVPDGVEDSLFLTREQKMTLELESESDEELMEKLHEIAESGNWNKATDTRVAKLLLRRGAVAAAKDEKFQRVSLASGGVTKEQVIEWMNRSETFERYEQIMLSKWTERTFWDYTCEAMKDAGYTKASYAKWALPEDILPRSVQCENVSSDEEVDTDEEDLYKRKQERSKVDAVQTELESKTNEELMEMLREDMTGKFGQPEKVMARRACLAASQDKNIQEIQTKSGGVTKAQIIAWIDGSETFREYKKMILNSITEESFKTRLGYELKSTGYVRYGTGPNTRWALPKVAMPRSQSNIEIKSSASTAGKRKREHETFVQHKKYFNVNSDSDSSSHSSPEEEGGEDEEDDNPWLGCVCGRTHPFPIKVFWIQCGACDAWHNVAEECVGFNEEAADSFDEWLCWSCNPPCAGLNL